VIPRSSSNSSAFREVKEAKEVKNVKTDPQILKIRGSVFVLSPEIN